MDGIDRLYLGDLEPRASPVQKVAAATRQLLRAHDAHDLVAVCLATTTFDTSLRLLLQDHLGREPTWDAKASWCDGISARRLQRPSPAHFRLPAVSFWAPRADAGASQWIAPLLADLHFVEDLADLASYTLRFGVRGGERVAYHRDAVSRMIGEVDADSVDWAYFWLKDSTASERS